MTWSEHMIARAISLQTLNRKCVVLVDNCGWTGYECDVLGVTTDLRIIDVEVKISRADLKIDAKKDKWWHRVGWGCDASRVAREWPPKVWKHYYALPRDLWMDSLFDALPSPRSGVLLLEQRPGRAVPLVVDCVRRATPNKDAEKLTPADVIDIARLANLRMWESYAKLDRRQRDAEKQTEAATA